MDPRLAKWLVEEWPLCCVCRVLAHPLFTRPAQAFALTVFRDSRFHTVDRGGIERTGCAYDMPCILAESNAASPQAIFMDSCLLASPSICHQSRNIVGVTYFCLQCKSTVLFSRVRHAEGLETNNGTQKERRVSFTTPGCIYATSLFSSMATFLIIIIFTGSTTRTSWVRHHTHTQAGKALN